MSQFTRADEFYVVPYHDRGYERRRDDIETNADRIEAASRALLDTSETAQAIQAILRSEPSTDEVLGAPELRTRLDRIVASVAADTEVLLDVDIDTPVPYTEAIGSAITELLDNAIKHGTPDDGGVVTVTVTTRADDVVRFAVADEGPGIPEEEWSVIAGDREITQLQHASGLGLWLAKWVADRHGGDLRPVDTDNNTVAIDLPLE
jgi:signal transduction histidine kinase